MIFHMSIEIGSGILPEPTMEAAVELVNDAFQLFADRREQLEEEEMDLLVATPL